MGIEKVSEVKVKNGKKQVSFTGSANQNRAYLNIPKDSATFTGAAPKVKTDSLSEFLLSMMPNKIKTMVSIHEGMGEVQNQLINAVGTGLVAPLFIKYNPISDTDKDTRTYTAWRQPISAVLAVCTQAAIVVPFNALIKKLADVGYLGTRYNSSLFPSDDYVKKLVKAENPDKSYTKKEMKKAIAEYNSANFAPKLKEMIENDHIVFNTTDGITASTFEMPKAEFKSLFLETIDDIIKDEEKEIDKAHNKKFPKKLARATFFHRHPEESREILTRLQTSLTTLIQQAGSDPDADPKGLADATKQFNKVCKEIIKEIKKDPSKRSIRAELIDIVKEIKNKNIGVDFSTFEILQDKVTKMLGSVAKMEKMSDGNEILVYVSEVIARRVAAIDSSIAPLKEIKTRLINGEITVKEAQQIIDRAISESENAVRERLLQQGIPESEIADHIEMVESSATRLKTKVKSVASCIAGKLKKHAKSNIDGLKRWTGLGVSLAILPATCWLLNRIYPWFMDKAFPELSNKRALAKEKQNKKAEVK